MHNAAAIALPAHSGLLRVKPSSILIGVFTVPLAYYAFAESYRYYILRKRRSLHASILHSEATSQAIIQSIKDRFASLRCILTGRYMNVTDEWREPGFWEFTLHQLSRPFTGRLWWNGGFPEDGDTIAAAALPREEPDFDVIRRHSWRCCSSASTATYNGKESLTPASPAGSESESDWEKLEASRSGPSALAAPSSSPTTAASQPQSLSASVNASASASASPSASLANLPESVHSTLQEMTLTWLGQSTSLIQLHGLTFLTDPVFSLKPIDNFLAPSRLRPVPCTLTQLLDLQIIDYVLISHNHYDHLDIEVVKSLKNRVTAWIVPLGLMAFLEKNGIEHRRILEMDWWGEKVLETPMGELEVACTPAQHWSGRTPLDTNLSLWCGFVVKHPSSGKSFFHAGDTGYSKDLYASIGKIHAPITLGLIPIGSYSPRWMMSRVHTDPQGSVSIHQSLGIMKSIGVHWGTWIMSDERYDEPVKELRKVVNERGLKEEEFGTLPVGRTVVL